MPVHLVTREALHLYLEKVDDHGVLVFNVSNRYLDLRPLLDALAKDANLVALTQDDRLVSDQELRGGKLPSRLVVMARSAEDLGPMARDARWHALSIDKALSVWSDHCSNLFATQMACLLSLVSPSRMESQQNLERFEMPREFFVD